MMVLRNHTTDSPWPISNNPFGKFNQPLREDGSPRATATWCCPCGSWSAPVPRRRPFFPPEVVTFAEGTDDEYQFVFVDGGVTTYNNPAFLAYQMATAAAYGIKWQTGADRLLIVSIGTGRSPNARPDLSAGDLWLLDHARNIPSALMNAASDGVGTWPVGQSVRVASVLRLTASSAACWKLAAAPACFPMSATTRT